MGADLRLIRGSRSAASPRSGALPRKPSAAQDPATAHLWDALGDVMDPEVPVSLVDLGLIYDVGREGGRVEVKLSFTATACPAMGFIQEDIRARLLAEPGVEEVVTHVVWEPVWTPERISDAGRQQLREFGISL